MPNFCHWGRFFRELRFWKFAPGIWFSEYLAKFHRNCCREKPDNEYINSPLLLAIKNPPVIEQGSILVTRPIVILLILSVFSFSPWIFAGLTIMLGQRNRPSSPRWHLNTNMVKTNQPTKQPAVIFSDRKKVAVVRRSSQMNLAKRR